MHQPETRELARQLRANGMLIREVADQLGVPRATVTRWCNPQSEKKERVKARKRKFSKKLRCPECGKLMNNRASLCLVCYRASQRFWTRDRVVEAIRTWATEHGAAPTHADWMRSGKNHPALSSILDGPNPVFDRWSDALVAAGFKPGYRRKNKLTREQRQAIRREMREDRIKKALGKEEQ